MDNNIIDKLKRYPQAEANAAYIVNACNEYEELIKLKELAIKELAWFADHDNKLQEKNESLVEQNKMLLDSVKDFYLYLQVESYKDMGFAVNTDSKRAQLRNLIANVTGKSCEEIQNTNEQNALKKVLL